MSVADKLVTVAKNQEKVLEAGKKLHQDAFWEAYQTNCEKVGYAMAFAGWGWTDETYNPKRDISSRYSYNQMFYMTRITDTKVTINASLSTSNRMHLFNSASNLETIRKIIVVEGNTYSSWFTGCSNLKNVTFEGVIGKSIDFQNSSLLSRASIENIIGCLSTDVTGQTLTLSQNAVDNAFTTDEWNELISDKTNWSITLV